MRLARDDRRSLLAWMLFASVLLSLFACGLHHGQMNGLNLSGLNAGFCSATGGAAAVEPGHPDQAPQAASSFTCPLCSSFALAVALNSSAWALDYLPAKRLAPPTRHHWAQPTPRHQWPALNPRASPADFRTVNLSA